MPSNFGECHQQQQPSEAYDQHEPAVGGEFRNPGTSRCHDGVACLSILSSGGDCGGSCIRLLYFSGESTGPSVAFPSP